MNTFIFNGFAALALWSLNEASALKNQLNLFDSLHAVFMLGIIGAIIGIIIGALLGLLLGLANGLTIGIVTLLLFPALPDIERYLNVVRLVSVRVSTSGTITLLHLTIMRLTDHVFIFVILPAIVVGSGAWWASEQITKWYARTATGTKL